MARILIAGTGYLGSALGKLQLRLGHQVWTVSRTRKPLPRNIEQLCADLTSSAQLKSVLPRELSQVFFTAAPGLKDADAYRRTYLGGLEALLESLDDSSTRVIFTSSTSVYGQTQGEWVDESSETAPQHFKGQVQLQTEGLLRHAGRPSAIMRLGGIYGPGRHRRLIRLIHSNAANKSPTYMNHIHRDDAARALVHISNDEQVQALYLGVDSEPSLDIDVYRWLQSYRAQVGRFRSLGEVPRRGGSRERAQTNKRCSNAQLVASGFQFRYPSFREGYATLLKNSP